MAGTFANLLFATFFGSLILLRCVLIFPEKAWTTERIGIRTPEAPVCHDKRCTEYAWRFRLLFALACLHIYNNDKKYACSIKRFNPCTDATGGGYPPSPPQVFRR